MASATKAAEVEIVQQIEAVWTSNVQVAWEGEEFTPPSGNNYWLQVSILWGDGFLSTMGGTGVGKNEIVGIVQLDIFGPKGRGYGPYLTYADSARDILDRWSGTYTVFGASSGPTKVPDDTYHRVMIRTPFYVMDTT